MSFPLSLGFVPSVVMSQPQTAAVEAGPGLAITVTAKMQGEGEEEEEEEELNMRAVSIEGGDRRRQKERED